LPIPSYDRSRLPHSAEQINVLVRRDGDITPLFIVPTL
jgi:hypothetical protein